MTVINGIEINDINFKNNDIKSAINLNNPIDDILHVIIVISNPCQYAKRFILAKQFIKRFINEKNIKLYIVELAYKNQSFHITSSNNKNHLQISTDTPPLWHKENMINLGVEKLLPNDWKAFAWIDADIEFENTSWALDTLKILNGYKDVVQLFSHALDLDNNGNPMNIFSSFGHQYFHNKSYTSLGKFNYWHPGFAWAMTRQAYNQIGGLYDKSILGSGDNNIALCLIKHGIKSINASSSSGYKKSIIDYQEKFANLRLGYVPGIIKHYFHGHKKNRKYSERWNILVNNKYDPFIDVTYNKDGLLIPTNKCPQQLLNEIYIYFQERNEDD